MSIQKYNLPKKLNKLLPFVAIGTIADCQSIAETTNRILVKAGLRIMQHPSSFVGLEELLSQTGLRAKTYSGYKINSQDLAFTLSPILNSSGRLSHARLSIAALLCDNSTESLPFADTGLNLKNNSLTLIDQLIATNQARKNTVKEILGEIESEAAEQVHSGAKIIFLIGNWSKGIIGLLASRLVNKYELPTVVISREENE